MPHAKKKLVFICVLVGHVANSCSVDVAAEGAVIFGRRCKIRSRDIGKALGTMAF